MVTALFPGSFDPVTNAHIDLISRACDVFDKVIVAIGYNHKKPGWLPISDRLHLLAGSLEEAGLVNVEVTTFSGLATDLATEVGANVIVKGLRGPSDWQGEYVQATANRRLSGINTILIPTDPKYSALSSSVIRELVEFNAPVDGLVPALVAQHIGVLSPQEPQTEPRLGSN